MCICKQCDGTISSTNSKKYPVIFCSFKCYEKWNRYNKPPNCQCVICGLKMYLKPFRLNRLKNNITCSKKCSYKHKSEYFKGEGNHQYSLKGPLNSSFTKEKISKKNHNLIDILIYKPTHPFVRSDNRIAEHRLLVEQNYHLFDSKFFIIIDNKYYLKKGIDVHHINGNHNDNRIENLQPMSRSEHSSLHRKLRLHMNSI